MSTLRSLLGNLQKLDEWLQGEANLSRNSSHALIGKYVYLHYLKDRDILSERKLKNWGIEQDDVFGRDAKIGAFHDLVSRLDDWLNGSVFPISFRGRRAPKQSHLQRVAATFKGDEIVGEKSWQLHLDFKAYDFSYIPIETLSVIYEQFLHTTVGDDDAGRGRKTGAYYTPVPLVNMMLAEQEDYHPLTSSTRILDPSCGSGAFLVQCYRRLIEKQFSPDKMPVSAPSRLREILEKQIFGVDIDEDACAVTQLSLTLTLLDYITPPDLENNPRFKLPSLAGTNIVNADFFGEDIPWKKPFDWIVGNPPWRRISPKKLEKTERNAWKWISTNDKERPVGGNQLARAFAWKVGEYGAKGTAIALLLPSMALFEDKAKKFRSAFFTKMRVDAIANLANLRWILFRGRAVQPAAAFFYSLRSAREGFSEDEAVSIYSPLAANQEPSYSSVNGVRADSWVIVINSSEIRDIPFYDLVSGDSLPWKIATWGSHIDRHLIERLSKSCPTINEMEKEKRILIAEGLQLRSADSGEDIEVAKEVAGKNILNVKALEGLRCVYRFPANAIEPISSSLTHARKGRLKRPLSVCKPPHVIVSAARNFAVYSDDYLVVPPRQIGIVSLTEDKKLLKALSLYLSSDFAYYHQFMTSPQLGVERGRATLRDLRDLPCPFADMKSNSQGDWVNLHTRIVSASSNHLPLFVDDQPEVDLASLLTELNRLVADLLGLSRAERAIVSDFTEIRLGLNDGNMRSESVREPTKKELLVYAKSLKRELDDFIGSVLSKKHSVSVLHDALSGMVEVNLKKSIKNTAVHVLQAGKHESAQLEKTRQALRGQKSQWVYFDRNLRVYDGVRTLLLKPMQRFHWTESQAIADAQLIIAESVGGIGECL